MAEHVATISDALPLRSDAVLADCHERAHTYDRENRLVGQNCSPAYLARWAAILLAILLMLAATSAWAIPLLAFNPSSETSSAAAPTTVVDTFDAVEIRSSGLTVHVQRHPWQVQVLDPARGVLLAELPEVPRPDSPAGRYGTVGFSSGGRWFHATDLVASQVTAGGAALDLTAATNDPSGRTIDVLIELLSPQVARFTVRPTNPAGIAQTGLGVVAKPDEHYFGFGEQFGSVDQRGRTVVTWVHDRVLTDDVGTYKAVPFFVTNDGYGLVVESFARTTFEMASARPDAYGLQISDSSFQFTVLYGPEPLAVLGRFADLVGHWTLPPAWAFGVWRTSIGGQDRVLGQARRLRQLGIPVTALFVYDATDDDLNLGWPWHIYGPIQPGSYPDIPSLNAALHGLGFHVLGYLAADVRIDRGAYPSLAQRGYLIRRADGSPSVNVGGGASLDFTNPAAVAWWRRVVQDVLKVDDFDGWMQDFGELAPVDGVYTSGRPGSIEHNRYPLLYAKATYQAAMAVKPDYVSFARAAALGAQPFLRLSWPGDQSVDWSPDTGLPSQIPAMLSAAMSGIPDYAPDVAGFYDPAGGPLSPAAEKELWIRWVELGALSPTFRDLLGARANGGVDLWTDDDTVRIYRDYARLHVSLMPYIYRYARLDADTGQPILRHPFLEYPSDPNTYGLNDEYFLGDALLMCPVLTSGARARACYLPDGSWTDFWTGQAYRGPGWVTLPAPLERIPILVRAGAIVPTGSPDACATCPIGAAATSDENLILRLVPRPDHPEQQ